MSLRIQMAIAHQVLHVTSPLKLEIASELCDQLFAASLQTARLSAFLESKNVLAIVAGACVGKACRLHAWPKVATYGQGFPVTSSSGVSQNQFDAEHVSLVSSVGWDR